MLFAVLPPVHHKRVDCALGRVPVEALGGVLHHKRKVFGKVAMDGDLSFPQRLFQLSEVRRLRFCLIMVPGEVMYVLAKAQKTFFLARHHVQQSAPITALPLFVADLNVVALIIHVIIQQHLEIADHTLLTGALITFMHHTVSIFVLGYCTLYQILTGHT